MIGVVGHFFNPTTGAYTDRPCGWACWVAGRVWEWEAFTADRWLTGTSLNKTRAVTAAEQALNNLKQVKT